MAEQHFILNGSILSEEKSRAFRNNRGFLYGDGFFESMRSYRGKVLFADEHYRRILHTLALLEMEAKTFPTEAELFQMIEALCQQTGCREHARIRLSVYREGEGLYTPDNENVSYLLTMGPLESAYLLGSQGMKIDYFTGQTKAGGKYSRVKSLSSLLYVMAGKFARQHHCDELLLLNAEGRIIEGVSSNVFFVCDNRLLCPPVSEGGVDGVMRKVVMELAHSEQIALEETPVSQAMAASASEIFFTSSVRGIRWAENFRNRKLENTLTARLFAQLVKRAEQYH